MRADRRIHEGRPDNLPHALTSFVGRELEAAEVRRLLRSTRLLTLTGTGGVGKSRLAQAVADSLLDGFPDGVWLVELAALGDPALVPRAVAATLGVHEDREHSATAALAAALRDRHLLLVLDNCEHLIEACAVLADALLRACPELKILATGRQALGTAGETTFRVPSLAVPPRAGTPQGLTADGGSASGSSVGVPTSSGRVEAPADAVRLFVERARAVLPGFTLTERNVSAVEAICQRLDGIPLAIELAAARIAVLTPEQIAARLGKRLRLLSGGSRTALPRYQTLRASIDWSHDLLGAREQLLLRRLAVFVGGWILEAAEAVCACARLDTVEILDLLSELVSKSLVQTVEQGGVVRYTFLETLREYAAERLREAGEEETFRDRHRDWFVALAERTEPVLEHAEEPGWFDRLDAERDNLRAVARRAAAQGDAETAVRLGAALWQFWMMQADAADARERVDAIVTLAASTPLVPARAKALDGAGVLARLLGDYPAARALGEESLVLARQLGDRQGVAVASYNLGRLAFAQVRYEDARVLLDEALAVFERLGHRPGVAAALNRLGLLAFSEGNLAGARVVLEQSLATARETGSARLVGSVLYNLGLCAHYGGDLDTARRLYEEWRAINAERGDRHDLAAVLQNLGHVMSTQGDLAGARELGRESLVIAREAGNRRRLVVALWPIATLAAAEGDWECAVRLSAAAETAAEVAGVAPGKPTRALWDAQLDPARRALGSRGVAVAVAAGRALTLEQAVDDALSWLAAPGRSATRGAQPELRARAAPGILSIVTARAAGAFQEAASGDPLADDESDRPAVRRPRASPATSNVTLRELEVARLIARGMTNRQIATELVVAEGTAANHVKNILARLGLDSRVQIATWAVEQGLLQHATA